MVGGYFTKILNNYKGYLLAGKLCFCILGYDTEVLVIAPCGFAIDRTLEEIHLLTKKEGWDTLKAVQNNAVFIADFELFTQSSAGTLVDGIEVLAGIFHPEIITVPPSLSHRVKQLDFQKVTH